jgi:hypothetical protein
VRRARPRLRPDAPHLRAAQGSGSGSGSG